MHESWIAWGRRIGKPDYDAAISGVIARAKTPQYAQAIAEALNALGDKATEPKADRLAQAVASLFGRWVNDPRVAALVGQDVNRANLALSAGLALAFADEGYNLGEMYEREVKP